MATHIVYDTKAKLILYMGFFGAALSPHIVYDTKVKLIMYMGFAGAAGTSPHGRIASGVAFALLSDCV